MQDDLVLMVENDGQSSYSTTNRTTGLLSYPDGQYHLDAASVCLPGFWRVSEKFRMLLDTLHTLHIEAGVPHY